MTLEKTKSSKAIIAARKHKRKMVGRKFIAGNPKPN